MRLKLLQGLALAIVSVWFTGCGAISVDDSSHNLEGEAKVKIDWGLDQFEETFREECQEKYDRGEITDIEKCINDKITTLIDLINTGLNGNEEV
jgi:hypothetical protein